MFYYLFKYLKFNILFKFLINQKVPNILLPKNLHNHGNYIISLSDLCKWLAEQAE